MMLLHSMSVRRRLIDTVSIRRRRTDVQRRRRLLGRVEDQQERKPNVMLTVFRRPWGTGEHSHKHSFWRNGSRVCTMERGSCGEGFF